MIIVKCDGHKALYSIFGIYYNFECHRFYALQQKHSQFSLIYQSNIFVVRFEYALKTKHLNIKFLMKCLEE